MRIFIVVVIKGVDINVGFNLNEWNKNGKVELVIEVKVEIVIKFIFMVIEIFKFLLIINKYV